MVTSILSPRHTSEQTYSRILHAVKNGQDPIAAAKDFYRNPIKSVINELRIKLGYQDLYAEHVQDKEAFAKAIVEGLYEMTPDESQQSKSFNLKDAQNNDRSYCFCKTDNGIVLRDSNNNIVISHVDDQWEAIKSDMVTMVNYAIQLAQTEIKNGGDPANLNQDPENVYECSLAKRSEIKLRAARQIIEFSGSFEAKAIIQAANCIFNNDNTEKNLIADVVSEKNKIWDQGSIQQFTSYITDNKNSAAFTKDKLDASMLWVIANGNKVIANGNNLSNQEVLKAVQHCAAHILENPGEFENFVEVAINHIIQTRVDDNVLHNKAINYVIKNSFNFTNTTVALAVKRVFANHHNFDRKIVTAAIEQVIELSDALIDIDHRLTAMNYVCDNPGEFTIDTVKIAKDYQPSLPIAYADHLYDNMLNPEANTNDDDILYDNMLVNPEVYINNDINLLKSHFDETNSQETKINTHTTTRARNLPGEGFVPNSTDMSDKNLETLISEEILFIHKTARVPWEDITNEFIRDTKYSLYLVNVYGDFETGKNKMDEKFNIRASSKSFTSPSCNVAAPLPERQIISKQGSDATQLPPTEASGLAQSGQATKVVKPPRLNAHESKHLKSKSPSEDGGFYLMMENKELNSTVEQQRKNLFTKHAEEKIGDLITNDKRIERAVKKAMLLDDIFKAFMIGKKIDDVVKDKVDSFVTTLSVERRDGLMGDINNSNNFQTTSAILGKVYQEQHGEDSEASQAVYTFVNMLKVALKEVQ